MTNSFYYISFKTGSSSAADEIAPSEKIIGDQAILILRRQHCTGYYYTTRKFSVCALKSQVWMGPRSLGLEKTSIMQDQCVGLLGHNIMTKSKNMVFAI